MIGCTGQAGNDNSGVAFESESGSFMSEYDFDMDCDNGYECYMVLASSFLQEAWLQLKHFITWCNALTIALSI